MRTAPPPELTRILKLLDLHQWVHKPRFTGWENIPDERPLLFVGNHTIGGILDVPLLFRALWEEKGIFLNALGDRAHFKVPGWGSLLSRFGVVEGSPETCSQLFEAGSCVLVFPGGAREVAKKRSEINQLVWGDRRGFARMAVRHGVTIVPFAEVGVEQALDIVWDADDMAGTPFGKILDALGLREDLRVPFVRGVGPTPIPRPERFEFHFSPCISTRGLDPEDRDIVWEVREQTRRAVEDAMAMLLERRQRPS